MLRQLVIHDVVLIDRLDLEFEPGLGVLTGETGAGKSILLDALGLALGTRADTGAGPRRAGAGGGRRAEFELAAGHASPRRCSPSRASSSSRASRCSCAARSRPTAAAAPSPAARGARRALRDVGARGWSKSTASMTTAACSTPRATAPCSTPSGGSTAAPVAARLGEVAASSSASWPTHAPALAEAPTATANGSTSRSARSPRSSAEAGEESGWPRSARRCRPAARIEDDLAGARRALLGGSDGGAVAIAPGGAADRAGRRRPSVAGRGAGRARPRDDRGGRGRGPKIAARRRRAGAFARPSSRRPRRGCSTSAGWRASTASRPTRWPRCWRRHARASCAAIDAGGERIAELEAALAEARDATMTRRPTALTAQRRPRRPTARRWRWPPSWRRSSSMPRASAPRSAAAEPGPGGHRPRRIRSVDQSRRAVRAADQNRLGRRIVALHPRAEGRAGRGGRRARR